MYNFKNVSIMVNHDFSSNMIEIWLLEERPGSRISYHYDGNKIVAIEIPSDQFGQVNSPFKPFLKLPYSFAMFFFRELAGHSFFKSDKPKNESKLEGQLIATQEHLSDMREFSRKLLDIQINKSTNQQINS